MKIILIISLFITSSLINSRYLEITLGNKTYQIDQINELNDILLSCRLNENKVPCPEFGINGQYIIQLSQYGHFEVQSFTIIDNELLIAGIEQDELHKNFVFLLKLKPDGSPDQYFGQNGLVITEFKNTGNDEIKSLEVSKDGKILVSLHSQNTITHIKYNKDGMLDRLYADDGFKIVTK